MDIEKLDRSIDNLRAIIQRRKAMEAKCDHMEDVEFDCLSRETVETRQYKNGTWVSTTSRPAGLKSITRRCNTCGAVRRYTRKSLPRKYVYMLWPWMKEKDGDNDQS